MSLFDFYSSFYLNFWQNHNLPPKYDFHSYMIRSMEEEFQRIVGVRWDVCWDSPVNFVSTIFGKFMIFSVKSAFFIDFETILS